MTKYKELNELMCENIKQYFKLESNHYALAKKIKNKYQEYMEMEETIPYVELDNNYQAYSEINDDFLKKYTSPLKEGNDGFWYFGFVVKFKKDYDNLSYVSGQCPIVLGIKLNNEGYEIKNSKEKIFYIENQNQNLDNLFDEITKNIKLTLDFSKNINNKKIGFE